MPGSVGAALDKHSMVARYWWWEGHDFVWKQLDQIRIHRPPNPDERLPDNVIPIGRYRDRER